MRTREELDRELRGSPERAEELALAQMRELALDQRDLLVQIRDLLKMLPVLAPGDVPMAKWMDTGDTPLLREPSTGDPMPPSTTITSSPDSMGLKDSQSLG